MSTTATALQPRPLLSIEIGEAGVIRVISSPRSVAEATKASQLAAKTALFVRALHEAIISENANTIANENTKYTCVCGCAFTHKEDAIRHVEEVHCSEFNIRDLDATEDAIERMISPL